MGTDDGRTTDAQRGPGHPAVPSGPLTVLVVDASVAVVAALAGGWPRELATATISAPTLLWSEVAAALRQMEWRGEVDAGQVRPALAWVMTAGIEPHASVDLVATAWEIASTAGWAKTYDAEYLALAQQLAAPLVTLDARLRRTSLRAFRLVGPTEV